MNLMKLPLQASLLISAATLAAVLLPLPTAAGVVQVTVLGRDGQPLPDAVVVIDAGTSTSTVGKAPSMAASTGVTTIAQLRMQFVPMVTIVPVGARVRFTYFDSWDHHVRGLPAGSAGSGRESPTGFELRLAGKTEGKEPDSADVTLDKAGPVQLGCHLHGSMRGFVLVADSPWYAKTNANGIATLPDVPDGAARVRLWHADQLVDIPATALQVTSITTLTVPTLVQPRRRRS